MWSKLEITQKISNVVDSLIHLFKKKCTCLGTKYFHCLGLCSLVTCFAGVNQGHIEHALSHFGFVEYKIKPYLV